MARNPRFRFRSPAGEGAWRVASRSNSGAVGQRLDQVRRDGITIAEKTVSVGEPQGLVSVDMIETDVHNLQSLDESVVFSQHAGFLKSSTVRKAWLAERFECDWYNAMGSGFRGTSNHRATMKIERSRSFLSPGTALLTRTATRSFSRFLTYNGVLDRILAFAHQHSVLSGRVASVSDPA